MKKWCILLVCAVLLAMVSFVAYMRMQYPTPTLFQRDKIDHVIKLISMIEEYRETNGKLPPESYIIKSEIDGYFYHTEENHYEVGFSIGFDYSYTYSSSSGRWDDESVDVYYRKHVKPWTPS